MRNRHSNINYFQTTLDGTISAVDESGTFSVDDKSV
jgi:hypothetical protein